MRVFRRSHLLSIYIYYLLLLLLLLILLQLSVLLGIHALLLIILVVLHLLLIHLILPLVVHPLHIILLILVFLLSVFLLVLHIFRVLLVGLEVLLVIGLLVHRFHVLGLRQIRLAGHHVRIVGVHALGLHRHHHSAGLTHGRLHLSLLLQSLGAHALVTRRTEWTYFLLAASDIWRSQLAIVISSEVAIGRLTRQHSAALLLLFKVTDCALVAIRVVCGECLGALGAGADAAEGPIGAHGDSLQSSIICANAVEEVRVSAKAVTVLANHVLQLLLLVVIVLPLIVVVI